jgi:hypothetical protein
VSEVFSAGASIYSAKMQANAVKDAANTQVKALREQRDYVYANLNPEVMQEAATSADVTRAKQQLALQSELDPALTQMRYLTEENLLKAAQEGGASPGDKMAAQLFEEAMPEDQKQVELKNKLLDAAIAEIDQGAVLPPDVQAELVKAGLERSGTIGTGTSSRGLAGQLTRKLIGNEAIALKAARQEQAVRLGTAASGLQEQRLKTLSTVFPQLKALQTQNVATQASLLGTAESMTPEAGLGGQDIANIFLARVGATNQLAQGVANAKAQEGLGIAKAWSSALGTAGGTASGVASNAGLGSTGSLLSSLWNNKTPSGTSTGVMSSYAY